MSSSYGRSDPARRPSRVGPVEQGSAPPDLNAVETRLFREEQIRLKATIALRDMAALGHTRSEVFDQIDHALNPTANFTLLNYQVPPGQVLGITQLAVVYSDPAVGWGQFIGWQVTVNANRVPLLLDVNSTLIYNTMGSISEPADVTEIFVQARETVALAFVLNGGFAESVQVVVRAKGRIYTPPRGL